MAWRAGDEAPTDIYRTTDGRLAEAVRLDEPHEQIVLRGETLTAEQAAAGRELQGDVEDTSGTEDPGEGT